MANGNISGFIPQVWQAALVKKTEKSVTGKNFVTEVQGQDIAYGNSVHINTFGSIAVQDYVNGTELSDTELDITDNLLAIDKQKAFNIPVYDTDMAQVRDSVELMNKVVEGATVDNAVQMDIDIFTAIIAGNTNKIGSDETPYVITTGTQVKELFRQAKVKMNKLHVPRIGRRVAVSSEVTTLLLLDDAFANAYYSLQNSENPLLADGYIGKYMGFEIFETELVPNSTGGKAQVIFTHPKFNAFAHQISTVEDVRMPKGFGDYVRGLNVYGVKSIVDNSVVATVSFQ